MQIQAFISCLPLLGGGRESQPFWGWWGAAGEVLTEVGEYEEATGKSKQCSLPRAWWLGLVGEKTAKEGQGQYLWISVGKATAMFMKNLTNLIFTFQVRELGADRLRTPRATRIAKAWTQVSQLPFWSSSHTAILFVPSEHHLRFYHRTFARTASTAWKTPPHFPIAFTCFFGSGATSSSFWALNQVQSPISHPQNHSPLMIALLTVATFYLSVWLSD